MSGKQQSFPPSLNRVRSEFDILCDQHGGPVQLSDAVERSTLAWACQQFYFKQTWPAYHAWELNEAKARRYWPWVALAAAQYQFERGEKATYGDEPKPSELAALVNQIATHAKSLGEYLAQLQELSYRVADPEVPERRGHMAWIWEYIAQNLAAGPRDDVDPTLEMAALLAIPAFCEQLTWVEMAAKTAVKRISPELLRRVRPQSDRALSSLVLCAAKIWESLTSRRASVNKVARKNSGDERPDFAIFVANITKLACGREPTLDEITTAFRRVRTPNSETKKSQ